MELIAENILHKAFRETLNGPKEDGFAPQLLRDAERYLKGETISSPGLHADYFFSRYEPY